MHGAVNGIVASSVADQPLTRGETQSSDPSTLTADTKDSSASTGTNTRHKADPDTHETGPLKTKQQAGVLFFDTILVSEARQYSMWDTATTRPKRSSRQLRQRGGCCFLRQRAVKPRL